MELTDYHKAEIYRLATLPEYQREVRKLTNRTNSISFYIPNCAKIAREIGCSRVTIALELSPIKKEKRRLNQIWNYYIDPIHSREQLAAGKVYRERYRKTEKGRIASQRARDKHKLRNYTCCTKGVKALKQLFDTLEDKV